MNDKVLKCLEERRSVRSYKAEQISDSRLEAILKAGLYAPTGMNRQSPVMVVFQDREIIAKLSELNARVMGSDADPFYGAPTVIMVLADKNVRTWVEDGALVMGNLMNAAHAVGVDSCWIHRAREVSEMPEGREILRSMGIGDEYVGVGNCILGYGAGEYPEARERRPGRVFRY
ncbi:MAG: nitroreductase [Bacillota bacterium]|nr:nitroreductase [Bacillota bacterium]